MESFQQSLSRFLNRTIWARIRARILFAAIFATLVMLLLVWMDQVYLENQNFCKDGQAWLECLLKRVISVITINNIQSFGVIFVASLYVLEGSDRKRRSHYEAWQILDAAIDVKTSYARQRALQDLNKDGISLKSVDLPLADLDGVDLFRADLREASLAGASLKGANLREANLRNADLRDAILTQSTAPERENVNRTKPVDLTGANLTDADLRGADLTDAILNYACLKGTRIDATTRIHPKWRLVWLILNNRLLEKYLQNADLSHAYLRGVSLEQVDLEYANLAKTDLQAANLQGANLQSANLSGAMLQKANLTKACLVDASLQSIRWSGANFTSANFTDAKLDKGFLWRLQFSRSPSLKLGNILAQQQPSQLSYWIRKRKSSAPGNVFARKR